MIGTIITGLLILTSLYFIKKASKKKSKLDENGYTIHRLPLLYGIGGIIPLGICAIIIVASIFKKESSNLSNIIPIILLFAFLGIMMCLMVWMNKISMNGEEIIQRNMWGKIKTIKLNEIDSINFDKVFLHLNISDNHNKIKCHEHLIGFDEIISNISNKTQITKAEMGITE